MISRSVFTVHISSLDRIRELRMYGSSKIPERMRFPEKDHILFGRETIDHMFWEGWIREWMNIDEPSWFLESSIYMMRCDAMLRNFMHSASSYLEFYRERGIIFWLECESEMQALISIYLGDRDIVLVSSDVECIVFPEMIEECVADFRIIFFDDHSECENIAYTLDLHILLHEDFPIDTENTLTSSRYERDVWKGSEYSLQCTEKLMDHISFRSNILYHLWMDILIDSVVEDWDAEFIEDELVFMEIVFLEESRTEIVVSKCTYSSFFDILFLLQISDKKIQILCKVFWWGMDQVFDVFSDVFLVLSTRSDSEKNGFEKVGFFWFLHSELNIKNVHRFILAVIVLCSIRKICPGVVIILVISICTNKILRIFEVGLYNILYIIIIIFIKQ